MSVRVAKINMVFLIGKNVTEITLDIWAIPKICLLPAMTALSLNRLLLNETVAVLKMQQKIQSGPKRAERQ
jgi:hypothetical protein